MSVVACGLYKMAEPSLTTGETPMLLVVESRWDRAIHMPHPPAPSQTTIVVPGMCLDREPVVASCRRNQGCGTGFRWDQCVLRQKMNRLGGDSVLDLGMMKLEEIVAEAAQLDEACRASLASHLIQSLSPPAYAVPDEEVSQRIKEAEEDPGVMITHEELVSGIKRRGD